MTVSATREFEQKISVQQGKDNPQYPLEEVLQLDNDPAAFSRQRQFA
jgi:hypothetical protein